MTANENKLDAAIAQGRKYIEQLETGNANPYTVLVAQRILKPIEEARARMKIEDISDAEIEIARRIINKKQ